MMDSYYISKISPNLQGFVDIQNKILQCGRFIGNALESLPISKRAPIIKEMQRVQNEYRFGIGTHSNLSLQLMRIEHYKMNPGFYEDPDNKRDYVPKSYGDAMVAYIASIPISKRNQALNDICAIAFNIAGNEFRNLITNKNKLC